VLGQRTQSFMGGKDLHREVVVPASDPALSFDALLGLLVCQTLITNRRSNERSSAMRRLRGRCWYSL